MGHLYRWNCSGNVFGFGTWPHLYLGSGYTVVPWSSPKFIVIMALNTVTVKPVKPKLSPCGRLPAQNECKKLWHDGNNEHREILRNKDLVTVPDYAGASVMIVWLHLLNLAGRRLKHVTFSWMVLDGSNWMRQIESLYFCDKICGREARNWWCLQHYMLALLDWNKVH